MWNDDLERLFDGDGLERLLPKGTRCIAGLSGGADSVTLLLLLKARGYDVTAAHCNFRLRGEESDRDERFCTDLCRRLGVKLCLAHFDTRSWAAARKMSIETAARELRYAYFAQLKRDTGADVICTAHHRDDSVETVLMNLIRGTGIQGLTGIPAVNGDIVRPLLNVTRSAIEDYLRKTGQDYVTDSSNMVNDVTRNRIRLDVMPLLRGICPAVGDNIARTARHMSEAAKMVRAAVERSVAEVVRDDDGVTVIDTGRLKAQPSAEYTLFAILRDKGFSPATIGRIYDNMDAGPGREWHSASHTLFTDRGMLSVVETASLGEVCMTLPEEGTYAVSRRLTLRVRRTTLDGRPVDTSRTHCCIDARDVAWPLTVRTVRQGDRFRPLGMKGFKLLSDYMTDRKMTGCERRRQTVVTDAGGRIVWVVNERPDDRFRITDSTRDVIMMDAERTPDTDQKQ